MVTLEQIKDYMRSRAEEDRQVKAVHQTAGSLEEALSKASIELGVPVKRLEYEILARGSGGFLNFGKKPWTIIAYKTVKKTAAAQDGTLVDMDALGAFDRVPQVVDAPGKAFVRLYHDGAYLKVVKPLGSGEPVTEEMALELLHHRQVRDINKQAVKGTVKLALGTYAKVGEFIHNPAADAMMTCDLGEGEMQGILMVNGPAAGGADLSREEIERFLKNNGIVHGLKDDVLNNFVDEPEYGKKIVVAEGTQPIPGKDARIVYFFDTNLKIKPKEFEDGRVDFKNLNNIHNVIKGEDLAKKEPAERGTPGRTVTGRSIPTKDGKDCPFEIGNNVILSKDGLKATAAADGQVILQRGVLSVETVLVIDGDVNNAVGNINSFGSVVVKGNVEDGFTVKANGNIEVMGAVGKSFLETPGDIILHQGVNGKKGGMISAGQNLWCKYIQQAEVKVGNYVICPDGILSSNVEAGKKILCRGKRAAVKSSRLRATEEINVNTLGGQQSEETTVEVGVDPKSKEELETMIQEKENLEKAMQEAALNIANLTKHQKVIGKLPPEKEAKLKELKARNARFQTELSSLTEQLERRKAEVETLKQLGKVSVAGKVNFGCKIIIRDVEYPLHNEVSKVTFYLEGGVVKKKAYEEIEEDDIIKRGS